jgi:glycine/D-amino acid oxidase-like deaminating enzyme
VLSAQEQVRVGGAELYGHERVLSVTEEPGHVTTPPDVSCTPTGWSSRRAPGLRSCIPSPPITACAGRASPRGKVPIIDRSPSGPLITVTGLSGHGFKFAPVFGELAAELTMGETPELWSRRFSIAGHLDAA